MLSGMPVWACPLPCLQYFSEHPGLNLPAEPRQIYSRAIGIKAFSIKPVATENHGVHTKTGFKLKQVKAAVPDS